MDYSTILRNKTLFNESDEDADNLDPAPEVEEQTSEDQSRDTHEEDNSAEDDHDLPRDEDSSEGNNPSRDDHNSGNGDFKWTDHSNSDVVALVNKISNKFSNSFLPNAAVKESTQKLYNSILQADFKSIEEPKKLVSDLDNTEAIQQKVNDKINELTNNDSNQFKTKMEEVLGDNQAPAFIAAIGSGLALLLISLQTGKLLTDNNIKAIVDSYKESSESPDGSDNGTVDKFKIVIDELTSVAQDDNILNNIANITDSHFDKDVTEVKTDTVNLALPDDRKGLLAKITEVGPNVNLGDLPNKVDLCIFFAYCLHIYNDPSITSKTPDAAKVYVNGLVEPDKTIATTIKAIEKIDKYWLIVPSLDPFLQAEDAGMSEGDIRSEAGQERDTVGDMETDDRNRWINGMTQYAKISRAVSLTIMEAQRMGLGNSVLLGLCKGLGIVGGILRIAGSFVNPPLNKLITSAANCMIYTSTTVASGKGLIDEFKKGDKKSFGKILALSAGTILSGISLARSGNALVSSVKDNIFYNQTMELIDNPNKTVDRINSEMADLEKQKQECIASGDQDKLRQIEEKQLALQESKDVAEGFKNMSPQERMDAKNAMRSGDYDSCIGEAKKQRDAAASRTQAIQQAQMEEELARQAEQNMATTISEFQNLPDQIKAEEAQNFIKNHADEGTGESNWYANALESGDPETINKAKQIRAYVNSSPKYIQEAENRKLLLASYKNENLSEETVTNLQNEVVKTETENALEQRQSAPVGPETAAPMAVEDAANNNQLFSQNPALAGVTQQQILRNAGINLADFNKLDPTQKNVLMAQLQQQYIEDTERDATFDAFVQNDYNLGMSSSGTLDTSSGICRILNELDLARPGVPTEQLKNESLQCCSGILQNIRTGKWTKASDVEEWANNHFASGTAKNILKIVTSCFGSGTLKYNEDALLKFASSDSASGIASVLPAGN